MRIALAATLAFALMLQTGCDELKRLLERPSKIPDRMLETPEPSLKRSPPRAAHNRGPRRRVERGWQPPMMSLGRDCSVITEAHVRFVPPDTYLVDRALRTIIGRRGVLASEIDLVPVAEGGVRVAGVRWGSLFRVLGVRTDDRLESLDDKILQRPEQLFAALLHEPKLTLALTSSRGRRHTLHVRFVEPTYRLACLNRGIWPRRQVRNPAPGIELLACRRLLVKPDGPLGYLVHETLLAAPDRAPTPTRLMPAQRKGKFAGLRLWYLHEGSLLRLIGWRPGDLVKAIDDRPLTRPRDALALLDSVRQASAFRVTVRRRRELLHFRIRVSTEPLPAICLTSPKPTSRPSTAILSAACIRDAFRRAANGDFRVPRSLFVGELVPRWLELIRVRAQFDGPAFKGMRVIVPRETLATVAPVGLEHQDLIVSLNGAPLTGPNIVFSTFERSLTLGRLSLGVRRGDRLVSLTYLFSPGSLPSSCRPAPTPRGALTPPIGPRLAPPVPTSHPVPEPRTRPAPTPIVPSTSKPPRVH